MASPAPNDALRRALGAAVASVALIALSGCAGSTVNSGVGDAFLERSPYYAGRGALPPSASLVHLPIGYQRGATQPAIFEPGDEAGGAVVALLAEMNAYLEDLDVSTLLVPDGMTGAPPDVQFGCQEVPGAECALPDPELEPGAKPQLRLAVARPSAEWVAWLQGALDTAGATHALVLTLELSETWPRQTNWRGSKAVDLGTDHVVALPWLTSLDDPISVIQLTGALIGADGRALRIGAEGLLARRSSILASAVGAQRLITEEDVEALRTARREDLAGQPLVWEEALRTLVTRLAGVDRAAED